MNLTSELISSSPHIPEYIMDEINEYRARVPFTVPFQIPTMMQRNYCLTLGGRVQIIEPQIAEPKPVNPSLSLPSRIFDLFSKKLKRKTENEKTKFPKRLDKNLSLSREIISFVNERILISANYPNRQPTNITQEFHLEVVIDFIRAENDLKIRAERAMKFNVGNCSEMALVGLLCPEIVKTLIPVELFEIEFPGDHEFLVVGRNPNTDPEDPSTWNPDAVICDPWTQGYYPASLYRTLLKDCIGLMEDRPLLATGNNPIRPLIGEPRGQPKIIDLSRNS